MAAESAAIRHAWQRHSKLLLDEHDSGIEQTAIHDAHVSGKADRYSVRMTAAAQAAIPDAQRSVFLRTADRYSISISRIKQRVNRYSTHVATVLACTRPL